MNIDKSISIPNEEHHCKGQLCEGGAYVYIDDGLYVCNKCKKLFKFYNEVNFMTIQEQINALKKNYKRMTKKYPYYESAFYEMDCANCMFKLIPCKKGIHCFKASLQRLGELEDKIEQELLLELPCKVGDTVYMPWEYDGVSGVAELTVNDIFLDLNIGSSSIQTNLESDVAEYMRRYRYGLFEFNEVGKKIFLTKAEAEAKLAELRGGK